jgi:hypothetical protein
MFVIVFHSELAGYSLYSGSPYGLWLAVFTTLATKNQVLVQEGNPIDSVLHPSPDEFAGALAHSG